MFQDFTYLTSLPFTLFYLIKILFITVFIHHINYFFFCLLKLSENDQGPTGIFLYRQHPDDIINAVKRFESGTFTFDHAIIRNNALRFTEERFRKEFKDFVEKAVDSHYDNVNN